MPNENRKRGRREEKKRKLDVNDVPLGSKRQKYEAASEDQDMDIITDHDLTLHQNLDAATLDGESPFYGFLDEEEQEYFKRADSMLEVNQFADEEERALFLANVFKEANGKELKIASSQSCSRLMERLIIMSTAGQLKALFHKFSGHFLHLTQHRFGSHCCERLFLCAAPTVTQELTAPLDEQQYNIDIASSSESMENFFLSAFSELDKNLGYLMTDQFASHALRILLVILSGQPLARASTASLLKSKKKENVTITGPNIKTPDAAKASRTVPDSFQVALDKMISRMVAGLDTTYLRALATHPVGNPILQLLLEIEVSRPGKQWAKDQTSLYRKLLPDDPPEQGTSSASFVHGLLYDTVGSRLLEVIVQFAPGKAFKKLYSSIFQEKLGTLAKNETASYVVIKVIERLGKDDLEHAVENVLPDVNGLIERSRTSIIKTLIERCIAREVETERLATPIRSAYGENSSTRLHKMLGLNFGDAGGMTKERQKQMDSHNVSRVHGSLLAQSMLDAPGPLRELILDSLLTMDSPSLIAIAQDRTAARVLQQALTVSNPGQAFAFRRKMIQQFLGSIPDLAVDPIASHTLDALWTATDGIPYLRERIAEELLHAETSLRDSLSGRAVWRNWMMDLYKRRKTEWIAKTRGQVQDAKSGKSNIELARERFAAAKGQQPAWKRAQSAYTLAAKVFGSSRER